MHSACNKQQDVKPKTEQICLVLLPRGRCTTPCISSGYACDWQPATCFMINAICMLRIDYLETRISSDPYARPSSIGLEWIERGLTSHSTLFIVSQLIRFSSVTEYASDDQCFVSFHNTILVYMQFRLTNSQRYLVVGLVAFTKYRCEFVNLNCIFTTIFAVNLARMNKMLSYRRETELQGTLVLAESGRLELRDNILLIL